MVKVATKALERALHMLEYLDDFIIAFGDMVGSLQDKISTDEEPIAAESRHVRREVALQQQIQPCRARTPTTVTR